MPRYSRRRSTKRKRRARSRKRIARIAKGAVFGALNNKRIYSEERRGITITVPAGEIGYRCLNFIGGKNQFKDLITNSTGADGVATGAHDIKTAFKVSNYKCTMQLRNLAPHDIYVEFWELTPKTHIILKSGETLLCSHLLKDILSGNKIYTDDTADAYSDTNVGVSDSKSYFNTKSSFVYPSKSTIFNLHYRIVRKKKVKVRPGALMFLNLNVPNFTFRKELWEGVTSSETGSGGGEHLTQSIDGIRGITKYLMMRVRGEIGHGVLTSTESDYMPCELAMTEITTARVMQITQKERTHGVRLTVDTLTGDLEGPSRYTKVDNNGD